MSNTEDLVGLALHQQLIGEGEDIPTDEDDWLVGKIVTPDAR
jgi:hypothetical protein